MNLAIMIGDTVATSLTYEQFQQVQQQALTALDLGTCPPTIFRAHDKYETITDENGKEKKGENKIAGETDGFYVRLDGRMPGVTPLHKGEDKLFSKSVSYTISAFKLEADPSKFATAKAKKTANAAPALTFDAVKAALAAK